MVTFELIRQWIGKFGPDYREAQIDQWDLTAYLSHGMRHLLPVVEGGRVVCEGSPSRAQYLEGEKRDTRGAYAYDESIEAEIREARGQQLLRYANGRNPFADLLGTDAEASAPN